MAKDKLVDYDSTASSNLDVGGVSVAEGMLPSDVNNAIREQMSHLKDFASGTAGIDVLSLADDDASHAIKLQAPSAVTADTTFTFPDGDGDADQVLKTDGSGQLGWTAVASNPSLIINGSFQVWQRGTSLSITTSDYFIADRWINYPGTGGAGTASQQAFTLGQTDVAGEPEFYLRHDQTTGASSVPSVQHRVEDVRTGAGQSVTLSFYAKVGAGTLTIDPIISQYFGTGGSPSSAVDHAPADITVTTLWQKFERTIALTSITGKTLGSDGTDSLQIRLQLPTSSTFTLDIAQVKFEIGSTATPIQQKNYGDELVKCQRYFELLGHAVSTGGNAYSLMSLSLGGTASNQWLDVEFKVEKRAAPSSIDSFNGYTVPSPTATGIGVAGFTLFKNSQMIFIKSGGSNGDAVASVSAEL